MITPHKELVDKVAEALGVMKTPGITLDVDGVDVVIRVNNIRASAPAPNPKNPPQMWYRYGIAVPNEEFSPGTSFRGETFVAVIDIAFGKLTDFDLFQTSALYHDAMLVVADNLQLSPDSEDWGIADVRIGVESILDSPAPTERLRFQLEVDFYYTSEI